MPARPPKFPPLEPGELEKLRRLVAEPTDGVREKRGGVLYTDPGVGGLDEGGRPSSFRCPGVKGMSDRSSFGRNMGKRLMAMLYRGIKQAPWYIYQVHSTRLHSQIMLDIILIFNNPDDVLLRKVLLRRQHPSE